MPIRNYAPISHFSHLHISPSTPFASAHSDSAKITVSRRNTYCRPGLFSFAHMLDEVEDGESVDVPCVFFPSYGVCYRFVHRLILRASISCRPYMPLLFKFIDALYVMSLSLDFYVSGQ